MLDKLIGQLGRDLDMQDLITSSGANQYTLPFSDDIDIKASLLDKTIVLKGNIGKCPKRNMDIFLLKTMEANLFGTGTRGAAIGFIEHDNLLTLSLEVDYNSSYKDFKEKLEDFVSVVDYWRKEALKHQA